MVIVFSEDPWSRIWYDGSSPLLFSKISIPKDHTCIDYSEIIRKNARAIAHVAQTHKKLHCLIDFSDCTINEKNEWCQLLGLIHQKKQGINSVGIVRPHNRGAQNSFIESLSLLRVTNVIITDSFFKALDQINSLRTEEYKH